jgi:hypothetical protein
VPDKPDVSIDQSGWQIAGGVHMAHEMTINQVQVGGDLVLTESSTREDFGRVVRDLQQQLMALQGVQQDVREELASELEQTVTEAEQTDPPKSQILTRLERVKQALRHLGGDAAGALALASSVATVAAWAASFL